MSSDKANSEHNHQPPHDAKLHRIERIAVLLAGIWIVALSSYLIVIGHDFDQAGITILKILLSFSSAAFMAALPGTIKLGYDLFGIGIRAGGSAAIFVFVYTQLPAIPQLGLAPPKVEVHELRAMDFRALDGPSPERLAASPIAITAAIEAKNVAQPSQTATLQKSAVILALSGHRYAYNWYYFVELLPGVGGTWLSSGQPRIARASDLRPGEVFSEEIMHIAQSGPTWKEFIEILKEDDTTIAVDVVITVDNQRIIKTCTFPTSPYRKSIEAIDDQRRRLPSYVSVECDQSL